MSVKSLFGQMELFRENVTQESEKNAIQSLNKKSIISIHVVIRMSAYRLATWLARSLRVRSALRLKGRIQFDIQMNGIRRFCYRFA